MTLNCLLATSNEGYLETTAAAIVSETAIPLKVTRNYEDAIRELHENHYDLLLVGSWIDHSSLIKDDNGMVLGSFELYKNIIKEGLEQNKRLKIISLCTCDDEGTLNFLKSTGADYKFFSLPQQVEGIVKAVVNYVGIQSISR